MQPWKSCKDKGKNRRLDEFGIFLPSPSQLIKIKGMDPVDRAIELMEALEMHARMLPVEPSTEMVPYIRGCINQLKSEYGRN